MSRKMLINAQRRQELRVAILSDGVLDAYQVAVADAGLSRGNIYRGVVAGLQPSLDAAFVDFGAAKDAFLSFGDVVPEAYHHKPPEGKRPRIDAVLDRGKPVVVQVTKEATGSKGAAVTTNLSLAGRYLVLMPYDDVRGISRKVEDDETRAAMRDLAAKLAVPEGYGFILRTAALDQNKTTLNRDLAALMRLWKKILAESKRGKGPQLLYLDQDLIVQAVRDSLDATIEEILVDDDDAFDKAQAALQAFMPRGKTSLVRYRERVPLFSRYGVEDQIESIFKRTVPLPSGGSIVIDPTEALTAIDVNSGRATRAQHHEDTYLKVNTEAAREVARQLRLRDIGGLVVVDFIDMRSSRNQKEVEKAMRDAVKVDRARVDVGRLSRNGLLEINRQRIGMPLALRTHRACPTCGGSGKIPSAETVSINLLRRIEERAAVGGIGGVRVALHPELADAFQNGYRQELAALEREFDLHVEIIASSKLHRSDEEISWTERPLGQTQRPTAPAVPAAGVADLTAAPRSGPADEAPDSADEAREGGRKKKRRSRKHKKSPAAQDAPPGETEDRQEPADEDESEPSADEPGEEPAPTATKRKRRRGGRKHRKSVAGSEPATAEGNGDGETAPPPGEPAEAAEAGERGTDAAEPGESDADAVEAGESGADVGSVSKRKRRRGGRRRKKGSTTEAAEAGDEAPDGPSGDEESAERDPFAY